MTTSHSDRLRSGNQIVRVRPVVIVSADATAGQRQRLLTAGASAYLTKPYEVQELLRVIDDALAASATAAESPPVNS